MRAGRVKRTLLPADSVYGNRMLTRFINRVMRSGKKRTAERVVYRALDIIKEKGEDPIKVFELAINTVGPKMEVRPRRVGGASYQVPSEVRGDRRIALASRWIVGFAHKRSNPSVPDPELFAPAWSKNQYRRSILPDALGSGGATYSLPRTRGTAEVGRFAPRLNWDY